MIKRLLIGATVLVAITTPVAAQPAGLVVSVASSLHEAVTEVAGLYRAATGVTVSLNNAGSNTLARQIIEGAKVGLFLSADDIQMDAVEKAGLVVPGTRTRLLTNNLAIIVPGGTRKTISFADLAGPTVRRVAMGEPTAVPAGVYGRKWLELEGVWAAVAPKVIPFPTVRAVLAAVESGRVDAGIVYQTDTVGRPAVMPLLIPRASAVDALAIVNPAAVIRGPYEAESRRFLAFLQSAPAREVFVRRGFGQPPALSEPKLPVGRVEG
jgi:molybdate transport system substrate-binding protein